MLNTYGYMLARWMNQYYIPFMIFIMISVQNSVQAYLLFMRLVGATSFQDLLVMVRGPAGTSGCAIPNLIFISRGFHILVKDCHTMLRPHSQSFNGLYHTYMVL